MKKQNIRFLALFLAMLMVLGTALTGCMTMPAEQTTAAADADLWPDYDQNYGFFEETTSDKDNGNELWVVYGTDPRTGFPPISSLKRLTEQFTQEYPDVSIRLEAVPNDEEELQHLQAQIMEGTGPDVMLICRNNTLIPDPTQAMWNGLFMDLSEYYDADTSIKKEELNQTIMDAGVYDGYRYIIPYSYDFPVAYVDTEQFELQGGSMDMFDGGIMKLYENLFATKNPYLIWGASISKSSQKHHSFNYLPDMLDYKAQKVLVTQEDIAQFLKAVQKARAAQTFDAEELPFPNFLWYPHLDEIRTSKKTWRDYTSMYIGSMPEHVVNVGYTQMSGIEIQAIPVAAADGDLVADVLFYGAVGAGCEQPDLAYAFLSWLSTVLQIFDSHGQLTFGWPVRITGSAENIANCATSSYAFGEFRLAFLGSPMPEITNDDIPFLDAKIDRVHFHTLPEKELGDLIDTLNDPETGEALPVDIDAVAANFVDKLKWHLAEG